MREEKPLAIDVVPESIPKALKEVPRWVAWKYSKRNGKWTKPPHNPKTKAYAKSNDPSTWHSFDDAFEAYQGGKGGFNGVGIVLSDDLVGIDLDHVLSNGKITNPEAQSIVERFSGTYIEVSPSGEGLRIFCKGKAHRSGKNTGKTKWLEIYDRDSPRYLTVTGHALNGAKNITSQQDELDWFHDTFMVPTEGRLPPLPVDNTVPDDSQLIEKIRQSRQGTKFSRLWSGDAGEDHSSADLALCSILSFWTGGDASRVDALFRQSGLMRPKWDEKHYADGRTYGQATIEKAVQDGSAIHGSSPAGRAKQSSEGWPEIKPLPSPGSSKKKLYPFDMLPRSLQKTAREVSRFTKTPEESSSIIGISAIATAIGKKAIVEERAGLTHHPALFFALIAPSGERKTPPFKLMQIPIETWIKGKEPEHKELEAEHKANYMVIDARIGKLRKDASLAENRADREQIERNIKAMEDERKPRPVDPRMFSSDITEQRLFQKMHDHEGSFAVLSSEGRPIFDNIMGRYCSDNRTADAIYLAGISGDTITRDRVGGDNGPEGLVVYNPCLNVCAMIQPDKYLEAARHPALRASGALARIWPVWLTSLVGHRIEGKDEPGLNSLALSEYETVITSILDIEREKDSKTGEIIPHKAILSTKAQESRRKIHNEIEVMMRENGDLSDVRDIASKAVSQICKLALVLQIAENPETLKDDESVIDMSVWEAAETIGVFHLTEAVRVQRISDESQELDMARRIVDWIKAKKHEEITTAMISQLATRPRPNAKEASEIIELLVDCGYGVEAKKEGKRKPVFRVNPLLFSQISHFTHLCRVI